MPKETLRKKTLIKNLTTVLATGEFLHLKVLHNSRQQSLNLNLQKKSYEKLFEEAVLKLVNIFIKI